VNANRRHYENAARALAKANSGWLGKLITRQIPLSRWEDAFVTQPNDIKVVIDFTA
jgi:glucose 1-dehydrogenase